MNRFVPQYIITFLLAVLTSLTARAQCPGIQLNTYVLLPTDYYGDTTMYVQQSGTGVHLAYLEPTYDAIYRFTSSVPTDFFVFYLNGSNTPIVQGTQPMSYQNNQNGILDVWVYTNPYCGYDFTERTITVTRLAPTCNHPTGSGTATLPTISGGTSSVSQQAGRYSTWNNAVAGRSYQFTSTVSTDYITVRSGTPGGPVVAAGTQPLTYKAMANATWYAHVSAPGCASQAINRTITAKKIPLPCTNYYDDAGDIGTLPASNSDTTTLTNQGTTFRSTWYGAVPGDVYVFGSSIPTDYLTLRTDSATGPAVEAGTQPLSYTATSAAPLFLVVKTNAGCGTDYQHRNIMAMRQNPSCASTQFSGVSTNLPFAYGYPVSMPGIQAGQYSLWSAAGTGRTYQFTSSVPTDYLTIRAGSATGPVLASGLQGIRYTATSVDVLFVQVNSDYECGVQATGRTITGAMVPNYCQPYNYTNNNAQCSYGWNSSLTTTGGVTNINHNPGCVSNGYADYSATVSASQRIGLSLGLSLTSNTSKWWNVYVDWNNDDDFTDPGELVFSDQYSGYNINGSFIIPTIANLYQGDHRMRVQSEGYYFPYTTDPCAVMAYGDVRDYTINVLPSLCAAPPTAVSATVTSTTTADISFTGVGDQYYAEVGPHGFTPGTGYNPGTGGVIFSGSTSPVQLSGLLPNTSYDVYVRQECAGPFLGPNSVVDTFYTGYCTPAANGVNGSGITNVAFGNLPNVVNNTTGPESGTGYYGNYSALIGDVQQTIPMPVALTFFTNSLNYGYRIYADLNNDFDFDDAGELLVSGNAGSPGNTTVTPTITIPAGTPLGQHRMRITAGAGGAPGPCQTNVASQAFEDYTINVTPNPTCFPPTGVAAVNTTATGTGITLSPPASGTPLSYEFEIRSAGMPGSGSGGLAANGTIAAPATGANGIGGLAGSTTYTIYVRASCGGGNYSLYSAPATFTTLPVNDYATGALLLTLGAGCTTNTFSSAGATASAGEPVPGCAGVATGFRSVWYRFVAPASGAVRISTDYSVGNMVNNRMALYSATDVSDYTTFTSIACDDDNGVINANRALLYAADLTPGTTYYILVDNFGTGSGTTYCLTVDELTSTMLVPSGSCAALATSGGNSYAGYRSLINPATGQLAALVRQSAGSTAAAYTAAVTVNTGAVRSAGNGSRTVYYLDRNFLLNSGAAGGGDVKVFFTNGELAALIAQPGSNVASIADLAVTRQTGSTCQAVYSSANGSESQLAQTASGSANGARWVSFTTPGFSNFYLQAGATPLPVALVRLTAENDGSRNRVEWESATEISTDRYELEKSSDGVGFAPLQTVNAMGRAYSYIAYDNEPLEGFTYYRLKMVDYDGSAAYSPIVKAYRQQQDGLALEAFPNPVADVLNIRIYGADAGSLTLTNAAGQPVRTGVVANGVATLGTGGLAAGIYSLRFTDARTGGVQHMMITKQ